MVSLLDRLSLPIINISAPSPPVTLLFVPPKYSKSSPVPASMLLLLDYNTDVNTDVNVNVNTSKQYQNQDGTVLIKDYFADNNNLSASARNRCLIKRSLSL
jgi:hypothetical protein